MTKSIVECKNLSKIYGGVAALHRINLTVQNGEFLTFLGPSGCGKTTLLRLLAGFEQPDTGEIFINGQNVTKLPPEKRHANMVFQSYALFPHMTVYQNVAFGLECRGVSQKEITQRVEETLRIVKLETLADRKPHSLSGGQKQRVAIARAVVNRPLVLLLDEPLSALDYKLRKRMRLELKELQRRLGLTFIFVTHDQEEALTLSDRVAVMDHGYIVQKGTPRDIYEEPNSIFAAQFIGETNVFEAVVEKADEKYMTLKVENTVFTLENTKQFSTGDKVNVIVRPEDIHVWAPNEVKNTEKMIPGVVEQVIYKGSTVDLMIRLPSQKLVAATEFFDEDDEELDYSVGEEVWIHWIPGWEVVLPYED